MCGHDVWMRLHMFVYEDKCIRAMPMYGGQRTPSASLSSILFETGSLHCLQLCAPG